MKQRRHRPAHLVWRAGVAGASALMMGTGVYPLVPHAALYVARRRKRHPVDGQLRAALREWAVSVVATLLALAIAWSGVSSLRAGGAR